MQVGDALVGVHHRKLGPGRVDRLDVGFDRRALGFRQAGDFGVEVAKTVIRIEAELLNVSACFSNTSSKKTATAWPNMIGSETFIMVALRCSESSTPFALASSISAA